MNENQASRGPSWGLLLLIPAALIVAKGAMRRRAMWQSGWAASGPGGHGYGHHGPFGGFEEPTDRRAAFRLPPKIEWMLDTWHKRAHATSETSETSETSKTSESAAPSTAAEPPTA